MKEHILKNECETRWGLTYTAVERFLEQEMAVRQVLAADHKASHLIPTADHLETLAGLKAALEPVSDLTDSLSGKLTMSKRVRM